MRRPFEQLRDSPDSFLASVFLFAWLEFRALRYYPANLVLSVIQGLVKTGIWFFIARFISGTANKLVVGYGGSYVAYVVIGVVFYEATAAALSSPFDAISTAFWDKRLEGYHLAPRGVWAYILGRFLWQWGYATLLQFVVLSVIVGVAGLGSSLQVHVGAAILVYLLLVATVFGIGLMGASLFFLLEIKQGKEPVSWLVDYAVRITSGVYIPVATLPIWLKGLGYLLPHTYALRAIRSALLPGGAPLGPDLAVLGIFAGATLLLGVMAIQKAILHAESQGGIGLVI